MISFASSPWQIFLILPSQAKDLFEKICPDEEFLQAVPNPEDIILDDFLQDGNQTAEAEPEGEAQADAVVQESTEEDCSSAGMVEEKAQEGQVNSEAADERAEDDAGVKDESPASDASQEQREDDQESKQSNEWSRQSFHWMTLSQCQSLVVTMPHDSKVNEVKLLANCFRSPFVSSVCQKVISPLDSLVNRLIL